MATRRETTTGAALGLTAALFWGSQFPVAKSLFRSIDPYTLTAIRYVLAAVAFVAVLLLVEGRRALRYDGQALRASVLGSVGVTGGVLLVYVGLSHTRAQDASLVVAAQPLLTALLLRARGGARLGRMTIATMAAAFAGVVLVISRGHPFSLVDGKLGWGIALVLVGQLGWVWYTVDSTSFGWSPLRFTALTALPASVTILVLASGAWALGLAHPSVHTATAAPWALAYSVVGPAILAVLAWNAGRARIGAQNIALFMNLVPVTTFAIETIRGYRPGAAELAGAVLTISALVANNLGQRRPEPVEGEPAALELAAEAA